MGVSRHVSRLNSDQNTVDLNSLIKKQSDLVHIGTKIEEAGWVVEISFMGQAN